MPFEHIYVLSVNNFPGADVCRETIHADTLENAVLSLIHVGVEATLGVYIDPIKRYVCPETGRIINREGLRDGPELFVRRSTDPAVPHSCAEYTLLDCKLNDSNRKKLNWKPF